MNLGKRLADSIRLFEKLAEGDAIDVSLHQLLNNMSHEFNNCTLILRCVLRVDEDVGEHVKTGFDERSSIGSDVSYIGISLILPLDFVELSVLHILITNILFWESKIT